MTHLYESDTNAMIREFLEIRKARGKLYFSRMQSGNLYVQDTHTPNRYHKAELCQPGTADWQVIETYDLNALISDVPGKLHKMKRVIWLEAKSTTGRQSTAQKWFHAWVVMDLGHEYHIIRSYEDMVAVLGEL